MTQRLKVYYVIVHDLVADWSNFEHLNQKSFGRAFKIIFDPSSLEAEEGKTNDDIILVASRLACVVSIIVDVVVVINRVGRRRNGLEHRIF